MRLGFEETCVMYLLHVENMYMYIQVLFAALVSEVPKF